MRLLVALAATGLLAAASTPALSQVLITSQSSPVTVDFSGFAGTGFIPAPAAGQLDSDTFAVTGMSDAACGFGGTCNTGDYARGISAGGATTGGVYAFDLGGGNAALGVFVTGADFTPGTLLVRIDNNTGGPIDTLDLDYDIIVFNNAPRANSFNLAFGSAAAGPFTAVPALDFTSPEAADTAPVAFAATARATTLSGLAANFQAGQSLFLQFSSNDVTGAGNRDMIGIDNLVVEATSVPVELMQFSVD
jgi:hypothetical protein